MAFRMTRIDRVYRFYEVTATLPDGTETTVEGVDVALLPWTQAPTVDTAWSPTEYADGEARVLLAGPDADPADALQVPAGGGFIWLRVGDDPETTATRIEQITVT